ncbi:hypothetical protein P9112_003118 [Eukaryota sp. TZLM1-RC]
MRFRCFQWPNNLPNQLTSKCGKPLLFTHLLNCQHFITFRSKVDNNVRDQIYVMCKSYRVDSFSEPLLSKLILNDPTIDSTRYKNSHAQYNLYPFVFSLLGSLGKAAMAFIEDFVVVVKERTGRIFNRFTGRTGLYVPFLREW